MNIIHRQTFYKDMLFVNHSDIVSYVVSIQAPMIPFQYTNSYISIVRCTIEHYNTLPYTDEERGFLTRPYYEVE